MKHGQGKLTKINSEEPPLFGAYANDKLDGIATKGDVAILYKDGMEIDLSEEEDPKYRQMRLMLSLFITCLFYGMLILYFVYE